MTSTCLMTSGAYIEPEMEAEFGRLPPTFLPIGNRRLFLHQRAAIVGHVDRLILSIPEDFDPDDADMRLLHDLGIEVVRVPAGLSLGQSIVYVINVTASSGGRFSVLHGDTLLHGIDLDTADVVSIGTAPPGYRWGWVQQQGEQMVAAVTSSDVDQGAEPFITQGQALSGWFSFADATLLVQAVTRADGDFIAALGRYATCRPLRTVSTDEWLDFGHANTYHQSRRRITTEREFNSLTPTRRTVVKSGRNARKIEAEGRWFEELPPAMRIHTPAFLGLGSAEGETNYAIEYMYLPTLTDLFVFGRLPRLRWARIFEACGEFINACARHPAPPETALAARALYGEKTAERLEAFARARNIDLSAPCRFGDAWLPSLERMAKLAADAIPDATAANLTLVHGDFCFSNILYDVRADLARVIDPRGIDTEGRFTPFGDLRYDLGKLHHSAVGRYDHIVAGYYRLQWQGVLDVVMEMPDSPLLRDIEAEFLATHFAGMTPDAAAAPAICVLLFLSMLPLHADNAARQDAFLANAMRLFLQLDAGRRARSFVA